jgi:benzil reductase ((S)-benzoin forming)
MSFLAVITGASSGIGASLARALVARGEATVIVAARRKDLLASLAAFSPSRIIPVEADITTNEGIAAIASAVSATGLKLRFLVQNAGTIGSIGPLAATSQSDWRKAQALNVDAPLFLTQALLPYFGGPKPARILHIGSGAAHSVIEGWGAYCVSKSAFLMMARILDSELSSSPIRVGSVRPGIVDTPMQTVIRTTGDFPDKARFIGFKEARDAHGAGGPGTAPATTMSHPPPSDELDDPDNVGAFLAWLLTESEESEFGLSTGKEWDIRDKAHHERWCGKIPLVKAL